MRGLLATKKRVNTKEKVNKGWRGHTEDRLGPISDAFHEWVNGHQGQGGGSQEEAGMGDEVGLGEFLAIGFGEQKVRTYLYQFN